MRAWLFLILFIFQVGNPVFALEAEKKERTIEEMFADLRFESEQELKAKMAPEELDVKSIPVNEGVVPNEVAYGPAPAPPPADDSGKALEMIAQRMKILSGGLSKMPQPPRLENGQIDIPVIDATPSNKTEII